MPPVTSQYNHSIGRRRVGDGHCAPEAPALRKLRRRRPGNRHAELLILCARIGFNP